MDSKILFFCVLIVNIYLITDANQVFNYVVTIKTADNKFSSHEGKLNLDILSSNGLTSSQEDFELTPNGVKLAKNHVYTANIASFSPLDNITSVYLGWNLVSNYNLFYKIKKPMVYFDPITIGTTYDDPNSHMSVTLNRKFCPTTLPIGIKSGKGASFHPCISN
ncbi:uncharacterized protein LOC107365426 [Tetranychus urticae]|uniref:PLAT domain-containing protein n=1 Tax=Tetranychus urticae TaxID=32264 RepID=T1KMF1_TETUR|nr:uncharacterized protein LOC107365426 [Tetranychus urticae]